ncbi:MAG: peptidoglycan DD-metalloendopeptidase family protein [Eubacterium sp.]|nr:peptidoglycan DD-metalloendopeptidase family protein [Eubacterium sp.]MCM1342521.1 peptidoglycan DD-metalloendopeptidase family protein [Muribaculaceae bacterium]MCM1409417.1 peptidoglycan DD-metalloendopeptidase family protein [Lachnospiraceae bacterium]
MRRNDNRKSNAKKERIVMFASSAFVLAALTMTGIYMKAQNVESEDNGYTIDFTAMEDSADNKYQEIAQNTETTPVNEPEVPEDDLDYMPMEVGSGLVQIPGLTDGLEEQTEIPPTEQLLNGADEILAEIPDTEPEAAPEEPEEAPQEAEDVEAASPDVVVDKPLNFSETTGLIRPVDGETVIPYSMAGTTYFRTLDHYKYNPAVMIKAEEGSVVSACAEGQVIRIFEDEEIGHAITMDLGNGYLITYGQLNGINVTLNSYVDPGEAIASVAAPTKYYSKEGSNLYLQVTKDGSPLDPESLF